MTKQKKEHLITYSVMMVLLSLLDFAYVKWQVSAIRMNGQVFMASGMMEYHDPTNGNTVYMPVYLKRN